MTVEKDALAGVMFDVPLMVARGYASLSFLHSAAEYINTLDVPAYIYHLGDFDPSGVTATMGEGNVMKSYMQQLFDETRVLEKLLARRPDRPRRRATGRQRSDAACLTGSPTSAGRYSPTRANWTKSSMR